MPSSNTSGVAVPTGRLANISLTLGDTNIGEPSAFFISSKRLIPLWSAKVSTPASSRFCKALAGLVSYLNPSFKASSKLSNTLSF